MNYKQQRAAIETKFSNGWNSTTTPIKFDNAVGLVKGSSTLKDESKLQEWCRITIENQGAQFAALGQGVIRHTGVINVTVFVSLNTGTDRARDLADKVSIALRGNTDDVITYYPTQVVASMQEQNGSFYQVTTQTTFSVDEYL